MNEESQQKDANPETNLPVVALVVIGLTSYLLIHSGVSEIIRLVFKLITGYPSEWNWFVASPTGSSRLHAYPGLLFLFHYACRLCLIRRDEIWITR